MSTSILDLDATQLARLIRQGEISSVQATETYIAHLQQVNPQLNVLVEDRFLEARAEAALCDEQIKMGQASGRLFGVPISVKECFDVAGMKTTGGLVQRRDHVAAQDADVVAKLRAEGAVVLGKSNTPSLCFCQETDNKVYGRTNNPWDTTRTAGGSSGGEGALIAAGGAAVGVGSDIGGSIRFPAHFNGVIGFRSGDDQVSQVGHFPFAEHPLQARMQGIGALAKSVEDAELLYHILAEQEPPTCDLGSFRVIVPPVQAGIPLGDETAGLLERVKAFLRQGYEVEETTPPFFERMAQLWQLIMSVDGGAGMSKLAFAGRSAGAVSEFMKEKLTGQAATHRYLSWALIGAKLFQPRGKQLERLQAEVARADEGNAALLDRAVLVMPVYHVPTLPHGEMYGQVFSIRKTFLRYMPYVAYANVLGLPALVVPVGTDRNGLPIAVQFVSRVGNEQAMFALGRQIEQQFRGYVRCTMYDR